MMLEILQFFYLFIYFFFAERKFIKQRQKQKPGQPHPR